jgi:hypothetical protein
MDARDQMRSAANDNAHQKGPRRRAAWQWTSCTGPPSSGPPMSIPISRSISRIVLLMIKERTAYIFMVPTLLLERD